MKRIIVLLMMFCFAVSSGLAQQAAANVQIKGVIIDNLCAGSQKPEDLEEFVKTHTKECALKPECVASGYSIFSSGKLMKFDKISSIDIEAFLRIPTSKLQVIVECMEHGDLLRLVYIENQK
ncbi:MAG: hypothetical protein KJ710_01730 [Candidatus Omnitrophica bacterium]|nr:hypothetical protein [Candidatus Omnitrophota bacterium]MBU1922971.1 hypothetical protein [Candidatus Omnitrophota bacterium]